MLYVQDGEFYKSKDDAPDMHSIECVKVEPGNVRTYQLQSADAVYLPKYNDLGADSTALCLDTSDVYKYSAVAKNWTLIQ